MNHRRVALVIRRVDRYWCAYINTPGPRSAVRDPIGPVASIHVRLLRTASDRAAWAGLVADLVQHLVNGLNPLE